MKNAWIIDQNRTLDIICLGTIPALVFPEQDNTHASFHSIPFGYTATVAIASARTGLNTAIFARMGKDSLSELIRQELEKEKVDITQLKESSRQLQVEDIKPDFFEKSKSLLINGTSLSTYTMLMTTYHAIKTAISTQTKVIFDLDYYPAIWGLTNPEDAEAQKKISSEVSLHYQSILPLCDLIIGTEEELLIAGQANSIEQALHHLRSITKAPLVMKRGNQEFWICDIFMSGFLRRLLCGEPLASCVNSVNGAIALTQDSSGAIPPEFRQ